MKKILIVDDEKDFCAFMKDYLLKRDFAVDVVFDGREAKDLLEHNRYDYVFFDCNMPELSGVELAREIQKNNPVAKKVMITGYEHIDEHFSKEVGIDLLLTKPVSLKQIKEIIDNA